MSKGDIILVPFPFTDLSGHKVRPALVLYDSKAGEDCVLTFISSLKQKRLGVFEVSVSASTRNGLKVDSVVRLEKIATLQKKIMLGKLGTLENPLLAKVNLKLKNLFAL